MATSESALRAKLKAGPEAVHPAEGYLAAMLLASIK